MDRGTRREFEHVTRRLLRVEDKTRNIPLRVGSGGSGQGGGGAELRVVEVVSAGDNTITTQEVPTVWKPYILRRDTYDNETIGGVAYVYVNAFTRTATKDMGAEPDIVETQEIVPNYYAGERIVIVSIDGFGWQDINTAGRSWAHVVGN